MDKGKRAVLLIAAICAAPVVASYLAFYFLPNAPKMNYGQLLSPPVQATITGSGGDGARFDLGILRGKWVYAVVDSGACGDVCRRKLYATRQVRKMQAEGQFRVTRVLLASDAAEVPDEVRRLHPDLTIVRADAAALTALPEAASAREKIYLLDPLNNVILLYPSDPDIKLMSRDLQRLLKASRVG